MDREGIVEPYSLIIALAIVPVVLDTLGLCASLIATANGKPKRAD